MSTWAAPRVRIPSVSRIRFRLRPAPRSPDLARRGFVAKLNSSGTALVYSTLLPVNPPALPCSRAWRSTLRARSTSPPQPPGPCHFQPRPERFQPAPPPYPNGSGVVAKLNASGSALLYATYLSGNGLTVPQGIAIDAAGDAFVAGLHPGGRFSGHAGSISNRLLSQRGVHGVCDQAESAGNGLGLFHISRRHAESTPRR